MAKKSKTGERGTESRGREGREGRRGKGKGRREGLCHGC